MSLSLVSLSSGSRGNCLLIFSKTTSVLIDAGISMTCIKKGLQSVDCQNLPKILVTHAHSDHVKGLPCYSKNFQPDVYCFTGAYCSIDSKMQAGKLMGVDSDFYIGDLTISPFRVSHDLPCVGYSVYRAGKKISVVTDIGKMTGSVLNALKGSDIVFLEANHDKQMLAENKSYPDFLKHRILSDKGHLSNDDSGLAAAELVQSGTKQIVLGHLSEKNNCPTLAYETVSRALKKRGITAGKDVQIDVASYGQMTKTYKLA